MGKTVEYIEREAAIRAHCDGCVDDGYCGKLDGRYACEDVPNIMAIPAADVRPVVKAKWEDVHIDRPEIADLEVASMFCPNCNRWHNEVFHYGNPIEFANYCQFCGADMRPEPEEETE